MTKAKTHERTLIGDIVPSHIYRSDMGEEIFGFGPEMQREKIRKGELPKPAPLSESSRIGFWTGAQILKHRAEMAKLAGLKTSERKTLKVAKTKKIKLQPPAKAHQRQRV